MPYAAELGMKNSSAYQKLAKEVKLSVILLYIILVKYGCSTTCGITVRQANEHGHVDNVVYCL